MSQRGVRSHEDKSNEECNMILFSIDCILYQNKGKTLGFQEHNMSLDQ